MRVEKQKIIDRLNNQVVQLEQGLDEQYAFDSTILRNNSKIEEQQQEETLNINALRK